MHVLDNAHPYLASFEITKNCNYRCVFCYQADRIRSAEKDVPRSEIVRGITPAHVQPEMSIEEIRDHLISQVAEMKVEAFCFVGAETLLRFDDIIALAPEFKKIKKTLRHVEIGTNGYLLDEDKIDRFTRAYRDFTLTLAIPLDSLNETIVKQLRPPKEDVYGKTMHAIDIALKKGMYITSGMVVTPLNIGEMEDIGKFLWKRGRLHAFQDLYPMFNTGRATEHADLLLSPDQMRTVDQYKITHYNKHVTPWDCMPFPVTEKVWKRIGKHAFTAIMSRGCSAGNNYFNIDHAGNVYPCNFLGDVYLGNVMDDPHALKNIWDTNPVVQRLRNRDVGGKCATCKYHINCGGCRSRALTETGDVFGGVESCDGGPDGHPLEKMMEKNIISSVRENYIEMKIYRALKKLRLAK